MLVAGNDQIGVDGQGAGQHLIVVGIVDDDLRHVERRDQCNQRAIADGQRRRRRRSVGSNALRKLRVVERMRQFVDQGRAAVERHASVDGQIQKVSRMPTPQQFGDDHVGIE